MALSADLVARAHRVVPDTGPVDGYVRYTPDEWRTAVEELLASAPAPDIWIFAYGSLLWRPVFVPAEMRPAVARGWHRRFGFTIRNHRGTMDRPGLMMGLDRGGQCRGVALRMAPETVAADLDALVRRELPFRPLNGVGAHAARWIAVETPAERITALAFVINRASDRYAGHLSMEETADILATACGSGGSCAEYLHSTVSHLEALGIRDRNLWQLQAMVARRLAEAADSDAADGTAHA
jgi:cation transport protein ChaC